LREKLYTFENFSNNFIFAKFPSNDIKVQEPQKQVGGPQSGHACDRVTRIVFYIQVTWECGRHKIMSFLTTLGIRISAEKKIVVFLTFVTLQE